MSKKSENVKKIKKYIDEILNTKSSLTAKRPVKRDRLRNLFCTMLNEIQFVNARAVGMKHDFNVDLVAKVPQNHEVNLSLSNSFGFGGTNTALLFKNF